MTPGTQNPTRTQDGRTTMMNRTTAILVCCACLAYSTMGAAASRSMVLARFQDALHEADYDLEVTGKWDDQTRTAMQALQEDAGFTITDFPDVSTLNLLEIDPSIWNVIAEEAGAPRTWIDSLSEEAGDLLAPPVSESILEALSGETL